MANVLLGQAIREFGQPVTSALTQRIDEQQKYKHIQNVLLAETAGLQEQKQIMMANPLQITQDPKAQAQFAEIDRKLNYISGNPLLSGIMRGDVTRDDEAQALAGVKYPVAEKPKYEIEFGTVGDKKGYVVTKDGVPVKERLEETTSGGAGGTSLQSEAEKIYLSQYNKNFEKYFEPLKNKYGLRNVNLSDIMLSISDIKSSKERTQKLKSIVKKRTNTNLSDEDAVALQNQYNADYDTAMYNAQQSALDTMEEGYYYDYLSKERKASHVKGTTDILSGTLEG